jgi:superfamily II DNA or RNA helicase
MWILHNRGSVLVADATGSGKTRMGAWLLRAAFDRLVRAGLGRRVPPVAIAPPPVVTGWKDQLQECGLNWEVHSHGPLSNNKAEAHNRLIAAIGGAELLAVDEAHNFLNDSERTKRLRSHYADHAVLFTATPINRGAADLIGLVELLGPDNFPDEALDVLKRLQRLRRAGSGVADQADRDDLRAQIQQFMVRRTRRDLNRIVDAAPEQYAMPEGRRARYPHHKAQFYALNAPKEDLEAARQIVALCAQLKGIARVGKSLFLPKSLAIEGLTEADYLQRVVRSAAGLARHLVLDCLRSSRIALYEHVHGTEAACNKLAPYLSSLAKSATGDTLETLAACAGTPPEWKFEGLSKDAAPAWLVDPEAHRQACEEERKVYADIAAIALTMSEAREAAKVAHLIQLQRRKGMVLAFDTHVLSLLLFDHLLRSRKAKVQVFSGEGGASAKRKAMKHFARDGEGDALIALCTDAFSEGMNLQAASVVVHLDTPTVIRTAEQRAGRVDRMDSLHDEVEIWFPRDSEDFAPRNRDLLMERHELVSDLIGPNLQLPEAEDRSDEALEVEKLADLDVEDPQALFDAFRPVRAMVEPGGLVGPRDYAAMRDSQAEVVSCVSLVSSDRMWAFFAVAGLDRAAPRWIFLDGPDAAPEGDLARVAASLAERLGPEVPDHPIDREAKEAISALVARLGACERDLLPVRRRRALELAAKVVPTWRDQAFRDDDRARGELLRELARLLAAGPGSEEQPDARAVADAWLHVFRQVQQRVDAEGGRRKPLRRLGELASALIERPVETETLRRAFRDIPLLPPVSERIVAMIVGVPVALG